MVLMDSDLSDGGWVRDGCACRTAGLQVPWSRGIPAGTKHLTLLGTIVAAAGGTILHSTDHTSIATDRGTAATSVALASAPRDGQSLAVMHPLLRLALAAAVLSAAAAAGPRTRKPAKSAKKAAAAARRAHGGGWAAGASSARAGGAAAQAGASACVGIDRVDARSLTAEAFQAEYFGGAAAGSPSRPVRPRCPPPSPPMRGENKITAAPVLRRCYSSMRPMAGRPRSAGRSGPCWNATAGW